MNKERFIMICKAACAAFNVDYDYFMQNLNKKIHSILKTRFAIAKYCKETSPATLKETGFYLGGKEHGTIINAIRKANKLYKTDPQFQIHYNKFTQIVSQMNNSDSKVSINKIPAILKEFKVNHIHEAAIKICNGCGMQLIPIERNACNKCDPEKEVLWKIEGETVIVKTKQRVGE